MPDYNESGSVARRFGTKKVEPQSNRLKRVVVMPNYNYVGATGLIALYVSIGRLLRGYLEQ